MRLDLFLPYLKRARKTDAPAGAPRRVALAILPITVFSDRKNARPGVARRLLKALGPTWHSAPIRRVIQGGCLLAFLLLFFYVCWPYDGSQDYAGAMAGKERIEAEVFLAIDPLVSISTAIAGRTWVWSLLWAAAILTVCVVFPRGFCGYLCPLGTVIDLFDWAIGKRVTRFQVKRDGWWVNLKYYLLVGVLISAFFGVLLSGVVAAIPVTTRGLQFLLSPVQMWIAGDSQDWFAGGRLIPPMNAGHFLSIGLFLGVLCLGFLRPRFWCRYVCPSGAVFSAANVFRASERKVEDTCIKCNKCIEICPFDAIKADFTTRTAECTLCQTCGGVCPTNAIKFVDRWDDQKLKAENDPPTHEIAPSRRGFLAGTAAGVGMAVGLKFLFGHKADAAPVVRPPGSVPEDQFNSLCIRCGECFKACPNNVLQPMGFSHGLDYLWTPQAVPSWSGCDPSCNNCGQVCPTGAIRALPIEEKRVARMGLAVVMDTCLPVAGVEACDLCEKECTAAGYNAIEFVNMGTEMDEEGNPIPDSGFQAPVVLAEKCVGCGLCQTRCYNINVKEKRLLKDTAILVEAGEGKEDRMRHGSYVELRNLERAEEIRKSQELSGGAGYYVPE